MSPGRSSSWAGFWRFTLWIWASTAKWDKSWKAMYFSRFSSGSHLRSLNSSYFVSRKLRETAFIPYHPLHCNCSGSYMLWVQTPHSHKTPQYFISFVSGVQTFHWGGQLERGIRYPNKDSSGPVSIYHLLIMLIGLTSNYIKSVNSFPEMKSWQGLGQDKYFQIPYLQEQQYT